MASDLIAATVNAGAQAYDAAVALHWLRDHLLDVKIGAILANDPLGDGTALDGSAVFPVVMVPLTDLLARRPGHRPDHAALLSDLLDALAGARVSAPAEETSEPCEELTDAERRVLRYLPSNLSAPEIADELCLSMSTVKTHMRHIYAKLGAHRRTEAVEQARVRGLLGVGRTHASAAAHRTRSGHRRA